MKKFIVLAVLIVLGLMILSVFNRKISASDNFCVSSDFNSSWFTELKGGSSFVTERFFENSGFSFEIIGANKKTKQSTIKKAKEKFILLLIKGNFLLSDIIRGTIRKKSITDNEASTKLKFRKESAEEASWFNKPK